MSPLLARVLGVLIEMAKWEPAALSYTSCSLVVFLFRICKSL